MVHLKLLTFQGLSSHAWIMIPMLDTGFVCPFHLFLLCSPPALSLSFIQ